MTQRIFESATLSVDAATKKLRVCLIREGKGSSADYPREFFNEKNAKALAESLSFPGHPVDLEHPEHRDPLSAIASIGDTVDIVQNATDGKMEFWADYIPSKSKPHIAEYLTEYGPRLGLSIYADSDGHSDTSTGKWIAESLDGGDPYKSVDLVVAAGAGGKFERVAESLRKLIEASATAGEEEEIDMEKIEEVARDLSKLVTVVEALVTTLDGKAKADAQVEADTSAVNKAVEGRLGDYAKVEGLLAEAKLTESQSDGLRALALKGTTADEIAPMIEDAKKVLAEARAGFVTDEDEDEPSGKSKVAENYLGDSKKGADKAFSLTVPAGFGKVA